MKKGFTMIELLAVVLILAVLTAIALPQYRRSLERTRVAEALQLLPAIYDARERLVTENDWTWYGGSTPAVSFAKLDIDMKGRQSSGVMLDTGNFLYQLVERCAGRTCVVDEPWVSGTLQKGTYKGTTIYYKGGAFLCCPNAAPSDSCSRLNLTQGEC